MPRNKPIVLISLVLMSCAGTTSFKGTRCEVTVPTDVGYYRAGQLALVVDHFTRDVARILSMPILDHVQVEVSSRPTLDAEGLTYGSASFDPPPRMRLGGVCMEVRELMARAVAHELAHIYFRTLEPDLPPMVEEGLSEYVGLYFSSPRGFQAELEGQLALESWPDLLEMSFEELDELPSEEQSRVRRASLALVLRGGFENLVGMLHDRERLQSTLEALADPATPTVPAARGLGPSPSLP